MRRILTILVIFILVLTSTGCSSKKAEKQPYSASFKCFDTVCTITVYDNIKQKDFDALLQYVKSKCQIFDDDFSKQKKDSFVAKLNKLKFYNIYEDYEKDILNKSKKYSKDTNGAFDITVSPLVDLWDIKNKNAKVPSQKQIDNLLKLVDYKQVRIDKGTAVLDKNGSIDLGAIAKGYVTDLLVNSFKEIKVKSAIIDLGGNIYAYGKKNNHLFRTGIKKPFGDGKLSAVVKASNKAIITSGIYQRYKKIDGKIYSHIIDPSTGRPVDNDLYSVTVISDNSTAADALSTGLMVMGLKNGMQFANKNKDIEAIFIDKNNKLHLTKGLSIKDKVITIK